MVEEEGLELVARVLAVPVPVDSENFRMDLFVPVAEVVQGVENFVLVALEALEPESAEVQVVLVEIEFVDQHEDLGTVVEEDQVPENL